mmetsp:Transcript_29117/g.40516  ORF Transcript_29117/g.40516 Transcript_29117/m.40516 type:complete len:138 (+) Transcript_29117:147-560(+)
MDNKEQKKGKTLAEAADEEEVQLTCSEKSAICWEQTKFFCHHKEGDTDLYCHNTCTNWGWLGLFFLCLYGFDVAFFALLLTLSIEYGIPVLYGYLAVFIVFVIILIIVVYLGHLEHLKKEHTKRVSQRGMQAADQKV